MTVRVVTWMLIIGILLGLLSVGLNVYLRYVYIDQQIAAETALTQQIQQNSNETVAALETAGVPAQQISQGFWYITTDKYGNQSVAYFDLSLWSGQQDLTQ